MLSFAAIKILYHNVALDKISFRLPLWEIFFLLFERSELEGKYFFIVSEHSGKYIVSVYVCFFCVCIHAYMQCVWEIVVCCHSGDAGLFMLHAWTVWLSWWVFKVDASSSSSHSFGVSYSQCRPGFFRGMYMDVTYQCIYCPLSVLFNLLYCWNRAEQRSTWPD